MSGKEISPTIPILNLEHIEDYTGRLALIANPYNPDVTGSDSRLAEWLTVERTQALLHAMPAVYYFGISSHLNGQRELRGERKALNEEARLLGRWLMEAGKMTHSHEYNAERLENLRAVYVTPGDLQRPDVELVLSGTLKIMRLFVTRTGKRVRKRETGHVAVVNATSLEQLGLADEAVFGGSAFVLKSVNDDRLQWRKVYDPAEGILSLSVV